MRLAMTILKTFLLPLAAGMLFRKFSPGWAEKLGDPIMRYAGIVLLIGAAIIIVSSFGKIMETGLPSILAFAGLTLMALATGHWLGGPDEAQRTSLAVSCATRHIGLALVLAADIKGPQYFCIDSDLPVRFSTREHPLCPLEKKSRQSAYSRRSCTVIQRMNKNAHHPGTQQ